jgi:hypothetical protein
MKEFFKNAFSAENRVKTIGIAAGIVVVIAVIVVLIVAKPFGNKDKKVEKQLNDRMTELAKNFYENYYFDQVGSEFVKGHAENGIKIDLANLARINNSDSQSVLDEFKNKDGEACNTTTTKVTIYPKDPYGKTDYELKIELDCNFKK